MIQRLQTSRGLNYVDEKIIAEILAVTGGFFFTIASAMLLGGLVFELFLPPFILGGVIFYFFARAWLYQVMELSVKKR